MVLEEILNAPVAKWLTPFPRTVTIRRFDSDQGLLSPYALPVYILQKSEEVYHRF